MVVKGKEERQNLRTVNCPQYLITFFKKAFTTSFSEELFITINGMYQALIQQLRKQRQKMKQWIISESFMANKPKISKSLYMDKEVMLFKEQSDQSFWVQEILKSGIYSPFQMQRGQIKYLQKKLELSAQSTQQKLKQLKDTLNLKYDISLQKLNQKLKQMLLIRDYSKIYQKQQFQLERLFEQFHPLTQKKQYINNNNQYEQYQTKFSLMTLLDIDSYYQPLSLQENVSSLKQLVQKLTSSHKSQLLIIKQSPQIVGNNIWLSVRTVLNKVKVFKQLCYRVQLIDQQDSVIQAYIPVNIYKVQQNQQNLNILKTRIFITKFRYFVDSNQFLRLMIDQVSNLFFIQDHKISKKTSNNFTQFFLTNKKQRIQANQNSADTQVDQLIKTHQLFKAQQKEQRKRYVFETLKHQKIVKCVLKQKRAKKNGWFECTFQDNQKNLITTQVPPFPIKLLNIKKEYYFINPQMIFKYSQSISFIKFGPYSRLIQVYNEKVHIKVDRTYTKISEIKQNSIDLRLKIKVVQIQQLSNSRTTKRNCLIADSTASMFAQIDFSNLKKGDCLALHAYEVKILSKQEKNTHGKTTDTDKFKKFWLKTDHSRFQLRKMNYASTLFICQDIGQVSNKMHLTQQFQQ